MSNRVLAAVLVVCGGAYAVGIDWGLPARGHSTWGHDELTPHNRGRTVMERHRGRYPPLQYRILDGVYEVAGLLPGEDPIFRQQLAARSTSLVMTLVTLGLIAICFRQLSDWTLGAPLAAALYGLSPVVTYYAKVANLEAAYMMWFAASVIFYIRILRHHRLIDYLLCTLFVTLAGITKDQAFALYVLPAVVALWSLSGTAAGNRLRVLLDRRVWLSLALFSTIFSVAHRPWQPAGFGQHLRVMLGPASDPYATYPASLHGYLSMVPEALWSIAFVSGVPALILAAAAVVRSSDNADRMWRLLAIFPLSSFLFFVLPIRYQYARFFLPVALIVALLAAASLERLAASRPRAGWTVAILAVLLLAARTGAVDYRMVTDARYQAEQWIDEHPDARVLGRYRVLLPRTGRRVSWDGLDRTGPRWLQERGIESAVAVPYELERGLTSEVISSLRDGRWGLTPAREFRSSPLPLVWPGVESNLSTVDPAVWALQRTAPWPPTPAELQTAIARLQPTSRLWSDIARDLWHAYRPRARHDLAASVKAFPVYRDAWTIGDLPALVMFPCHLQPEIQLRRPRTAPATRIEIRGPRLEREVLLRPGEPQSLRPGTASCEEYGAVRIRALSPWRPPGERRSLGVAVATLQEPSAADGAAAAKNH